MVHLAPERVGRRTARRRSVETVSKFDTDWWNLVPDSVVVLSEFEQVVERCCANTPPIFIRTLDALHIASARAVGETEIVAADKRMRAAAVLLGFQLFPTPTP